MKNTLPLIIVVVILSLFSYLLFAQSNSHAADPKIEVILERIDTLLDDNNISEAIQKTDSLSKVYFQNQKWEPYFLLELKKVEIQIHQENYSEGLSQAQNIARVSSQYLNVSDKIEAETYNLIGVCLYGQGHFNDAKEYFEKSYALVKSDSEYHPLITDNLISIGSCLEITSASELENSLSYYQQALKNQQKFSGNIEISSNRRYQKQTADILNNLGTVYFHKGLIDSTEFYFIKSLQFRQKHFGKYDQYTSLGYQNYGVFLEVVKHRYDSARHFYQESLAVEDVICTNSSMYPDCPSVGAVHSLLGVNFQRTGEYQKALEHLEKSLKIFETIGKKDSTFLSRIALLYNNIGATYYSIKQPQKALSLHELAHRKYREYHGDTPHHDFVSTYSNIASAYKSLGKFGTALEYYYNALEDNQKLIDVGKPSYQDLAHNYINIGEVFYLQGNLNKAEHYYRKALLQLESLEFEDYYRKGNCYLNLGNVYQEQGDYNTSLSYYSKARKKFETIYERLHPDEIDCLSRIGYSHFLQGNYSKALGFYQKILDAIGEESPGLIYDRYRNPMQVPFSKQAILVKIFHDKAITLRQQYRQRKNLDDLIAAAQTIKQCDVILDSLRKYYDDDRATLAKQGKSIYEDAIDINYSLFQETQDKSHQARAFYYSEKSKGLNLLLALVDSEAKKFAGIPEEALKREQALKTAITKGQNSILKQPNHPFYQDFLIEKKREFNAFVDSLENNYPLYYNAKYNPDIKTVSDIQKNTMDEESTMLSYFIGKENHYLFVVNVDSYEILKISGDSLLHWVNAFNSGIYEYWTIDANNDALYREYLQCYIHAATRLYDILIAPAQDRQLLSPHLVILPHEELNYLSFAALLSHEPTHENWFADYPYIIKKHYISYAYSATLLDLMQNRSVAPQQQWIGFAPSFSSSPSTFQKSTVRTTLLPLKYNVKEVSEIHKVMGGRTFIKEQASLTNFYKEAEKYRSILLATHATVNNESPAHSHISFTKHSGISEKNTLQIGDIYGLELNADMVVLSACETSTGKLQTGEGVLSLARAFAYAGAKNVVATLWDAIDYPSYPIMTEYHQLISEGSTKDAALGQSQRNYLNNTLHIQKEELMEDRVKHPYFWAGYITIGDQSSMEIESPKNSYWIYAMVCVILIILGWITKRKIYPAKTIHGFNRTG